MAILYILCMYNHIGTGRSHKIWSGRRWPGDRGDHEMNPQMGGELWENRGKSTINECFIYQEFIWRFLKIGPPKPWVSHVSLRKWSTWDELYHPWLRKPRGKDAMLMYCPTDCPNRTPAVWSCCMILPPADKSCQCGTHVLLLHKSTIIQVCPRSRCPSTNRSCSTSFNFGCERRRHLTCHHDHHDHHATCDDFVRNAS